MSNDTEAESMGWTPLEPGVYLHVSDASAAEVLVVCVPQVSALLNQAQPRNA